MREKKSCKNWLLRGAGVIGVVCELFVLVNLFWLCC